MLNYCVNKNAQNNGDHEVHASACSWIPNAENQLNLGYFPSCRAAVQEAKKYYIQSNGCAYCCPDCHTS